MAAVTPDGCPECEEPDYLGYEVLGVYDGVLYWVCPHCGHAFPRFVGGEGGLAEISQKYADEHNAQELPATGAGKEGREP